MDVNEIASWIKIIVEVSAYAIAGASVFLKGAEVVSKLTPSRSDDEIVSKMTTILAQIKKFMGKVALNPSEKQDT